MILEKDERFWDKGLHNFEENLSQPRHRWYPFKEGYSNRLVREAIESISSRKGKVIEVIDPFGGSGTTAVTTALLGHKATSIEVNPFCEFAAKVKSRPGKWSPKVFSRLLDTITKEAHRINVRSPLEHLSTFGAGGGHNKWLFHAPVIQGFEALHRSILANPNSHAGAFKLAAIKATMSRCNARKDGKALRYVDGWRENISSKKDLIADFRRNALLFMCDSDLAPIVNKSRLIQGDARQEMMHLKARSYDLLITSPPYLNSFDYSDVYRPELYLGRFVTNNARLRNIRLKTLRSHLQVKWTGATAVKSDILKPIVQKLRNVKTLWNSRIPEMVEAYFHDIEIILRHGRRVLRQGAMSWIVVSTSAYGGIIIPVDLIIADMATRLGFDLEKICVLRHLRAAGQQQDSFEQQGHPLRESLIILKNGE